MNCPLAVVFCFDQISPQAFPCYGNRAARFPLMDCLTSQAWIFHEHYATRNSTAVESLLPSTADFETDFQTDWQISWQAAKVIAHHTHIPLSAVSAGDYVWADLAAELQNPLSKNQPTLLWFSLSRQDLDTESLTAEELPDREQLLAFQELLTFLQSQLAFGDNFQKAGERELLCLITARQGQKIALSTETPFPFETALSESLSLQLWLPLIITGSLLHSAFGVHRSELTDPHLLLRLLQKWFRFWQNRTEDSADSVETFLTELLPDLPQPLLLETQEWLGLRTRTDLLVVSQSADFSQVQPLLQELKFYLKPEDRYDVNNLATTAPEMVLNRWETLRALQNKHD